MRLQNLSPFRYRGWLTASVADLTPYQVASGGGLCAGFPFAIGKQLGFKGHLIDLMVDLPPGADVDAPLVFAAPPPTARIPLSKMGMPAVNGVTLGFVDLEPGSVWHTHLRARVTPMLVADLWVNLADQGWADFKLRITASNTGIPDLTATIPASFNLTCGNAAVQFLTGGFGRVAPEGEVFGDGQSRILVGTFLWQDLLQDPVDQESAKAWVTGGVTAYDEAWRTNLGPLRGVPEVPPWFLGRSWALEHHKGALLRLTNWQEGPLGITANSGQTGAEEEQPGLAHGSAVFLGGGGLAVQTLRFVGYGFGRVPCHYREPRGEPLGLNHPDMEIWDGRPHPAMPDSLGKNQGNFGPHLSHGWWGPNDEHAFIGTLCSAYQLTGEPALQSLIHDRAVLWLYSDTVDPRMSTSGARAARARGWASIEAAWFWLTLEDRALAQKVKDRYVARLGLYKDAAQRDGRIWDPRPNDMLGGDLIGLGKAVWSGPLPSPYPAFVMGYQAAVAAGGIMVAGEVFDLPDARRLAYEEAEMILNDCFVQDSSGRWIGWEVLGVKPDGKTLPPDQFVEGQGAHHSGLFDGGAWWALAVWALLRVNPTHGKARAIWDQFKASALNNPIRRNVAWDWFPVLA